MDTQKKQRRTKKKASRVRDLDRKLTQIEFEMVSEAMSRAKRRKLRYIS